MIPHEKELVERLKDEPFALVGINTDNDKEEYFEQAEEFGVTWRSSWQGSTQGPIPMKWGVMGWPTLYLIDHEGVIREHWPGVPNEEEMNHRIDELVAIAESSRQEILLPPARLADEAAELVEEYRRAERLFGGRPDDAAHPARRFYARFDALAERGEGRAQLWVALHARYGPHSRQEAAVIERETLQRVVERFHAERWMDPLVRGLGERVRGLGPERVEALFRTWTERGPHPDLVPSVLNHFGAFLQSHRGDAGREEAVRLFRRVAETYPDTPDGRWAAGQVFRIERLQPGMTAPDLRGPDVDGAEHSLAGLRGRVVLLEFWGFWCESCRAMIPHAQELTRRMDGRPFTLLGVNTDVDSDTYRRGARELGVTWPSVFDGPERPRSTRWGVEAFPTLYLIDAEGAIRHSWIGDPGRDVLDGAVERLVSEAEEAARRKKRSDGR